MIHTKLWSSQWLTTIRKIYCNNNILNKSNGTETYDKIESIKENKQPFNEIPSANPLVLCGVNIDFLLSGAAKQLHSFIDKRHMKLGPIFREPMGPIEAVFVSSPALIRKVFLYEGKYPKHPLPEAWVLYNQSNSCKRGLFFMDDEEWLDNRKFMNTILLKNNLNWTQYIIEKETDKIIDEWLKLMATTVDHQQQPNGNEYIIVPNILDIFYKWSINVGVSLMFGKSYKCTDEFLIMLDEFSRTVHKIFETSAGLMSTPPKWAKKWKTKNWINFEQSVGETLKLANLIIDYGIKNIDMNDEGILQDMLKMNVSVDNIKRIFVDLIIASGDTVAYTTLWTIYLLSNNIDKQNLVRDDILRDRNNFEPELVRGTLREALRLYPAATFIGRFFATDGILDNYHIPKNTLVLLSMYTSGRNESSFPEATEFMPSRWIRNTEGTLSNVLIAHGTVPYALGSRSCIGKKVSNLQMHILIKKILETFHLKCFNDKPIDVIMKMIAVPNQELKIGIKLYNKNNV